MNELTGVLRQLITAGCRGLKTVITSALLLVAVTTTIGCGIGSVGGWQQPDPLDESQVSREYASPRPVYTGGDSIPEGEVVWKFPFNSYSDATHAAVGNGMVYFATKWIGDDNVLRALDQKTGQVKWEFRDPDRGGFTAPTVAGSALYVGAGDTFFALDALTGQVKWAFEKGSFNAFTSAEIVGGHVYIGDVLSLYSINAATGAEEWNHHLGTFNVYKPAIASGLVFTGNLYEFRALDAGSGKERWTFKPKGSLSSSPTVLGDTVFFCTDQFFYALDLASGTEKWKYAGEITETTPLAANGALYFPQNEYFFALDAATGAELWRFKPGNADTSHTFSSWPPVLVDGVLYIGSNDYHVYAVDAATGKERWRFKTDGPIGHSPVYDDGIIFFASGDKNFYAVNTATAKKTAPVICVMVLPEGEAFDTGAEEKLHEVMGSVERYFYDVSRGQVRLSPVAWATNGGRGYSLDHNDQYYQSENCEDDNKDDYVDEILKIPEVRALIPPSGDYTIVAFQPGKDGRVWDSKSKQHVCKGQDTYSYGWWDFLGGGQKENRGGSLVNIPFDHDGDEVAVIAHEIAHGLGSQPVDAADYNKLPPRKSQLPDLYAVGEGAPWGYTNVGNTVWGDYFLMGGRRPVAPGAFSQEWLGWVEWKDVGKDAKEIAVPYLDGSNPDVLTMPRIVYDVKYKEQIRKDYFVLEARSKEGVSKWDHNIPRSGVLVYEIEDSLAAERNRDRDGWPLVFNVYTLLTNDNPGWTHYGKGFRLSLAQDLDPAGGQETVRREEAGPIQVFPPDAGKQQKLKQGCVLKPDISSAPVLAGSSSPGSEVSADVPVPDLDLHAYLPDGTHIGINYETGEYENPVEGSEVSGDMRMGEEWIVLPAGKAEGARYEVVSLDSREYMEAFPEEAAAQSLELAYAVEPLAVDDQEFAIYRGEPRSGQLGPGMAAGTSLSESAGGLEIVPLEPIVASQPTSDESFFQSPLFMLLAAIAGIVLSGGVMGMLVHWQIRKRFR